MNTILQELDSINSKNPNDFWNYINKLGPKKIEKIEMCVKQGDRTIYSENLAFHNWIRNYTSLFYVDRDTEFHTEPENIDAVNMSEINLEISIQEVKSAIFSNKNGKGVGVDNLSNEALKSTHLIEGLTRLYNVCFNSSKLPHMWNETILCPIPKGNKSNPLDPLSYRGLSLQCCIYKTFSKILNNRFMGHMEKHQYFSETQNGFRKHRSTIEHVFTLTNLIKYCKIKKTKCYVCFVDFSKAFDSVDRLILLDRLKNLGINGKFLEMYKASYTDTSYKIKLNGKLSEKIRNNVGVKQGGHESPGQFLAFIEPLLRALSLVDAGVKIDKTKVNNLAYADDIVLIAESISKLQELVDTLGNWCKSNKICVNIDKTNFMTFQKYTGEQLCMGDVAIKRVETYKYLGVWIDEKLNFEVQSNMIAKSASRGLGSIINKVREYSDLNFDSFNKLFKATIEPILDYGCEIWNLKGFKIIDDIQFRAMRYFMGINKFAPLVGIQGKTGLVLSGDRVNLQILRLHNRILRMDGNRLPRIFYDKLINSNVSWFCRLRALLSKYSNNPSINQTVNIKHVKSMILRDREIIWKNELSKKKKLRFYQTLNTNLKPSIYLNAVHDKHARSLVSQLRLGILLLRVETGRYKNESYPDRICEYCNENSIEDEEHFLVNCEKYHTERVKYCMRINVETLNAEEVKIRWTVIRLSSVSMLKHYGKSASDKVKPKQSVQ